MIMIDTDIFIDNFRGVEKAKNFFEEMVRKKTKFHFSVITEAELISGKECEDKFKMEKVLQLLSLGDKVSINNKIARRAGEFRRIYNLTLDDSFIGASAFELSMSLVTRNLNDFNKINGLEVKKPY